MCPFSPPFFLSERSHTHTASLHFLCHKSNTLQFPCTKYPLWSLQNDLFFLSFTLPHFSISSACDLNTDNLSSNKYTHLYVVVFFPSPSIPSIHTGMEDNPPERNIEGLETEAEECASGKPNRRNSSVTWRSSSVDGQQELFPHEFTLSFPHFSSPPTFSTLFLYLPQGASLPFHIPPSLLLLLIPFSFFT